LVKRVLLASPRGYCAGVERAVETVERALALYGAPVYVRKQIVHNSHVVRELEEAGAVFVDDVGEIPEGAHVVFSALALPADTRLAYITQTTLSVDETREIVEVLRRRFPAIEGPEKEDICYATSNRQWAVKEMLGEIDLLLVVGSHNSSNSVRLVDVAHAAGIAAYLVDDSSEIEESWLDGVSVVGVTSGASAPERLVDGVCDWFRTRGIDDISAFSSAYEDVVFKLPVELRRAERSAA
jgi:4-hydroxy-3-methylbut-2-enyl diphosphate reductase